MNRISTAENGSPASTTTVCIAVKLPANSRPMVTSVTTADQRMRSQFGASSSSSPPLRERLASITEPESAGVRNSTKPTKIDRPMTIFDSG